MEIVKDEYQKTQQILTEEWNSKIQPVFLWWRVKRSTPSGSPMCCAKSIELSSEFESKKPPKSIRIPEIGTILIRKW